MNGLTDKLADKLVFFLVSVVVYLQANTAASAVVLIFVAVIASALASYLDRPPFQVAIPLLFTGLCLPYPGLCFFLPLLAFDLFATPWPWLAGLFAVPLVYHAAGLGLTAVLGLALLVLLAGYIHHRTAALERLRRQAHALRDASHESALKEARQREALLEKQDHELHVATLKERNRIAREIHDHVGHQLASAILQLGALMAVCRDAALKTPLDQLKTTLVDSMEQIRASVHDLHDQSVDLEAEVRRMAAGFTFCPLALDLDFTQQPDVQVRYALLAIIQEGLANIIRHSGATEARLVLREHPGFYQLILRDNGQGGHIPELATGTGLPLPRAGGSGMGLRNIEERVASLGGHVHFQKDKGFTVFVTIPRESRVPPRADGPRADGPRTGGPQPVSGARTGT